MTDLTEFKEVILLVLVWQALVKQNPLNYLVKKGVLSQKYWQHLRKKEKPPHRSKTLEEERNTFVWNFQVFLSSSSSSSRRAASTDIPDPFRAISPYRSSPLEGSSRLHPVSLHSCCMYVRAGRPAFPRPYEGFILINIMSSSLLLQQCPACLARLACVVFVMEGGWPYSWCLVGCCAARTCSILLATFLCNCRLASSPAVLLASK